MKFFSAFLSTWTEPETSWIKSLGGTFQSTSKEVIWPKILLNFMHGLKSAILAIFQKGLGWPCPASAALKNASQLLKNSFCFGC